MMFKAFNLTFHEDVIRCYYTVIDNGDMNHSLTFS